MLNSNLASKDDLANVSTEDDLANYAAEQDFATLDRRIDVLTRDVAVLKSDVRTPMWVVAGVGFGMLTVMLCVSSLVIKIFWTV